MDITHKAMMNAPLGVKDVFEPANIFHHAETFPVANFREVARPNFDTLYSIAWLDLKKKNH